MEAPHSLADSMLEVHLRGIDEPVFLPVSEATARAMLDEGR